MTHLTTKQLIFYFLFVVFHILLLIFGLPYHAYYLHVIIVAFIIIFWIFRSEIEWQSVNQYRLQIVLYGLYILGLLFTTFTSKSIPISIEALVIQIFIFLYFIFFLLLKKAFFPLHLLFRLSIFIPVIFVIFSILFLIIPGIGSLLPALNILYPTYGHNHLNSLILIFFPLVFGNAILSRKKLYVIIACILLVGLIVSFGRTAFYITILQIFLVLFLFRKSKLFKPVALFLITSILFVSLFTLQSTIYSVIKNNSQVTSCAYFIPEKMQKWLCKNFYTEFRISYWQQAVEAFKEKPLTGYGPGTFSIISNKYRQLPNLKTLYAHNMYLEIFSESGVIVGSLFILFIVSLFYRSIHGLKNDTSLSPAIRKNTILLIIGALGMCLHAGFDYDWHLPGLLAFTFFSFAVLCSQAHNICAEKNEYFPKLIQKLSMMIGLLLSIYCFLAVAAYVFTQNHKEQLAYSIFPHSTLLFSRYIQSAALTQSQKEILIWWHRHDTSVYTTSVQYSSTHLLNTLQFNLLNANPWYYLDSKKNAPTLEEATTLRLVSLQLIARAIQAKANEEWIREDVSKQIYNFAQATAKEQKIEAALHLFETAVMVWPLALHKYAPPLDFLDSSQATCEVLSRLTVYEDRYFGVNQNYYARSYYSCAERFPEQYINPAFLSKVHDLDGTLAHQLWHNLSFSWYQQVQKMCFEKECADAEKIIQSWYSLWEFTHSENWDVSFETKEMLVNSLKLIKDAKYLNDDENTEITYNQKVEKILNTYIKRP